MLAHLALLLNRKHIKFRKKQQQANAHIIKVNNRVKEQVTCNTKSFKHSSQQTQSNTRVKSRIVEGHFLFENLRPKHDQTVAYMPEPENSYNHVDDWQQRKNPWCIYPYL